MFTRSFLVYVNKEQIYLDVTIKSVGISVTEIGIILWTHSQLAGVVTLRLTSNKTAS